jgi:hypothetical protein
VDKAVQIEFNEESEPDLMALLANSPEDNRAAVVKTLRINVSVMGETGESEELLPIVDRQLVELINKERLSTSWFEVLGIVVTPPEIEGRKGKSVIVKPYRILAIDIRPLKRALQTSRTRSLNSLVSMASTACPSSRRPWNFRPLLP